MSDQKAAIKNERNRSSSSSPASNHRQSLIPEEIFIPLVRSAKSVLRLKQIHAHLLRLRLLSGDLRSAAAIIAASTSFRCVSYAVSFFLHLPSPPPSPHLFNALIRALSDSSSPTIALTYFALMLSSGIRPGRLAFPFAFRSSAALRSPETTAVLHSAAAKLGLELDFFVRTSLADAYGKVGSHELAVKVFDESPHWHLASNVLIWNVAISASCRSGCIIYARKLFDEMPERNGGSWNSLIDGYVKMGDIKSAAELFDEMPEKNVVSWTTMLVGLSRNGDDERALCLFEDMVEVGMKPNVYTVTATLACCAKLGALNAGLRVHEFVRRSGLYEDGAIGTALVDMYSKCGKIDLASHVFRRMKERDVQAWSAMILGWAVHGCWEEALLCFEELTRSVIQPDEGVFLAILMACSHAGKVDKGLEFFYSMKSLYQIEPSIKHYTCVVDMHGRAGKVKEALEFINSMPCEPDYVIWGALLSACRANKNAEIAEMAAERLLKLRPFHIGSQVFMSNMYAGAEMWDNVEKVRSSLKNRGPSKMPGWSYVEREEGARSRHLVSSEKSSPPFSSEVYAKLKELVILAKKEGYDEEEDEKGSFTCLGERLELAFGLINTVEKEIIIVKRLRVCGNCHFLMKVASSAYLREILLRDNKRFHRFKGGKCSCGDYW